jgi:hypothetical protein
MVQKSNEALTQCKYAKEEEISALTKEMVRDSPREYSCIEVRQEEEISRLKRDMVCD